MPLQIINANLELVSQAAEPVGATEKILENRVVLRQKGLADSLRTWLALQGHVNSLLDSTTAGPGAKGDVQVCPPIAVHTSPGSLFAVVQSPDVDESVLNTQLLCSCMLGTTIALQCFSCLAARRKRSSYRRNIALQRLSASAIWARG